jgi:hypothetical protein
MISSDDVDSIRDNLYEAQEALVESSKHHKDYPLNRIAHHLDIAIGLADDLRVDALDAEDGEE